MTPILSTRNVRKLFPLKRRLLSHDRRYVHAVDGVNIDIFEKETLALVGESGSGKSTLGQLLLGLHEPSAGTVIWSGLPLASLTAEQERQFHRDVQVVFQDPYGSLNPRMTVRSIIGRPLSCIALSARPKSIVKCGGFSNWSDCRRPARISTVSRTNFPAGNANGSPLGARSRSIRGSLLPMSPYPRWTFPCGRRFSCS